MAYSEYYQKEINVDEIGDVLLDIYEQVAKLNGFNPDYESRELVDLEEDVDLLDTILYHVETFGKELPGYDEIAEYFSDEPEAVENRFDTEAFNSLKDFIEECGWKVDADTLDNGETLCWDLYKHSPAGEDFGFCVQIKNCYEPVEVVNEIYDQARDFDEDEHVEMLVEARANGFAGVPSIKELVEDAAAIHSMMEDLAEQVGEWYDQYYEKKPSLDERIEECSRLANVTNGGDDDPPMMGGKERDMYGENEEAEKEKSRPKGLEI